MTEKDFETLCMENRERDGGMIAKRTLGKRKTPSIRSELGATV
jgi:hypothetical protein